MREPKIEAGLIDDHTYREAIRELLDGGTWFPGTGVLATKGRKPA